jgi:hypothetical protein
MQALFSKGLKAENQIFALEWTVPLAKGLKAENQIFALEWTVPLATIHRQLYEDGA